MTKNRKGCKDCMNNVIFNILLPLLIVLAFSATLVYQIFFNKKTIKKHNNVFSKCISYNADIHNSSPSIEEEFEILEKNNIAPNYLANRIGIKK